MSYFLDLVTFYVRGTGGEVEGDFREPVYSYMDSQIPAGDSEWVSEKLKGKMVSSWGV